MDNPNNGAGPGAEEVKDQPEGQPNQPTEGGAAQALPQAESDAAPETPAAAPEPASVG